MSDNRLRSQRLLAIGIVMEVVNLEISDAGDCSPLLGAEILLREVDGVQRVVSISLVGALGRIPSLLVSSMARFDINTKNSLAQVIVIERSMRSGTLVI